MTSTANRVELAHAPAVSECGFLAASALLFVASVGATVAWSRAMPDMHAMPMGWMPMCGQTWPTFAASFIGMWTVMMVAMMLPSALPTLQRYRVALRAAGAMHVDVSTALAGVAYFAVWTAIGVVVFVLGAALAAVEVRWPVLMRGVSAAGGAVVLVAGAVQFSAWKARQLARCRMAPARGGSAWRYGACLGARCAYSCAGLTAILLVAGVMDPLVMVAVSTAITLERLAPARDHMARIIGAVAVGVGLCWIAQPLLDI